MQNNCTSILYLNSLLYVQNHSTYSCEQFNACTSSQHLYISAIQRMCTYTALTHFNCSMRHACTQSQHLQLNACVEYQHFNLALTSMNSSVHARKHSTYTPQQVNDFAWSQHFTRVHTSVWPDKKNYQIIIQVSNDWWEWVYSAGAPC